MTLIRSLTALGLSLVLIAPLTSRAADIGGPFSLIDHFGNRVTHESYDSKYLLIFFGYTFCPDICPTELLVMGQALDKLGKDAERIQALFITIDPERDTTEALSRYLPNFHPDLVGLTGTPEEVAKAAKSYRVYFRKGEIATGETTYLMAHSSIVYFMNPDSEYLTHFVLDQNAETLAERIKAILGSD